MMYVLGMSHAINVLKAASATPLSFTHENWTAMAKSSAFFEVKTRPELLKEPSLQAFVVSRANEWGSVAEMRTGPDGQKQVAAVEGYIKLLESIQDRQDDGILFSFMHGNEHSMLSMVQHAVPYDFHLPWRPDLELLSNAQPLPFELVRRQMEKAQNATIGCLAMMRSKLPRMRLVHVMPPPPIESDEQIKQAPEVFRDSIALHGITPLSIRLKYYLLASRILSDSLKLFNVSLLECPAQAVGPSGAIKPEYAYGATHANEAYGELVVRQMQALAGA